MNNLILTNEQNGVLTISLNRIDKKNALNSEMYSQLIDAFNQATSSDSVRCVLIQGNSNCFCAGNDLQDFMENADNLVAFDFIKVLGEFNKPLVAAVAGPAVGIGTTLLLHCDMVVAANNSKFKLPFTQLGLCPEAASSYLLTQRVGYNRAFELLVLGDLFLADDAEKYGIVNKVTSPEDLLDTANSIATKIASLPNEAVKASHQLIRNATQSTMMDAMATEAKEFARLVKTPECKAILQSFFQK